MAPLSSDQRKLLEKVIIKARQAAEVGARNALEMLAVGHHEPHASMSTEERSLRNRLRARGRQLGDVRDKVRGTQSIDRLVHEVAYEYWHRMLFARFLTENHLLIEPNSGVPISMEECAELAGEWDEDPRSLASRFAQDSLPRIFRSGDPVLEVSLAPEASQALNKLLDSLPSAIFIADDSLGWTYQYWQKEKKDAINESGTKIGADELSAVTQLFTEHYMVLFLYHNTIGAWHAGRVLAENPRLAETARDEDELREAVRLRSHGGYDFKYLRFVREARKGDEKDTPTGPWHPVAGAFDGWPESAQKLTVLDPCCGSGHFLAEGLELLVRLRMDEESLSLEDAIFAVLDHNLHGLELDQRCTQIASFNLALGAWKLAGKPIQLPAMHIACSGLAVGSTKKEWTQLAGDNERLRSGMDKLYDLFQQAPDLGSLIDPKSLQSDLLTADFVELQSLLTKALEKDRDDVENTERTIAAQCMASTATLLGGEYTLVITNVPYLGQIKYSEVLREFILENYKESKSDLALVFLRRCIDLCSCNSRAAVLLPQGWLIQSQEKALRKRLLSRHAIGLIGSLGDQAFTSPIGAQVVMVVVDPAEPKDDHIIKMIDVSTEPDVKAKSSALRSVAAFDLPQHEILHTRKSEIIRIEGEIETKLGDHADALQGLSTGEKNRFERLFWEVDLFSNSWEFLHETADKTGVIAGRSAVILWEQEQGQLADLANSLKHLNHAVQSWRRGKPYWGKMGVTINRMGSLNRTLYSGDRFSADIGVIVPKCEEDLLPIYCFVMSDEFIRIVRGIYKKPEVPPSYLANIPFDIEEWRLHANKKHPNGLPEPESDDPTQWLFHGHPATAEFATVLQVAVGRLLGYRWPPELDPEIRLAGNARTWVLRGDELNAFADEDGVVCLSATRGERSAAERLRELLVAALGPNWSATKERELLAAAGYGKKSVTSLEVWLRDKFFEEHCKLFHHRPFIWHIWDGNREGFHCLANVHKLTGPDGEGRRTLEAITFSYLGDWIDRQKADQADGKEGADSRLAAAQDLQGQLVKILEGEPPFDLFVRWKPLHEQAIGWAPDINDGVRLNIRPFMKAELSKGGKKGAGILRWKPNIKWNKDRGKEPQSLRPNADFPWLYGCDDGAVDFAAGNTFDGNRWNDLHYTRAVKEASRERAEMRI